MLVFCVVLEADSDERLQVLLRKNEVRSLYKELQDFSASVKKDNDKCLVSELMPSKLESWFDIESTVQKLCLREHVLQNSCLFEIGSPKHQIKV